MSPSAHLRVTAKRVAQRTGFSLSKGAAPGAVVHGAASRAAWQQLGGSATRLAAPGPPLQLLCPSSCASKPPVPAPSTPCSQEQSCPTVSAHGLLSPSLSLLSGPFSVCFASKSPKREHLFCWTDPGLWAMRSSQATDSCPGSRLQVWCPQLRPEPRVAWKCWPSSGQHEGDESPACMGSAFSEALHPRSPRDPRPPRGSLGQCRSPAGTEVDRSCETPVCDAAPGMLCLGASEGLRRPLCGPRQATSPVL